jgi:hypothetical protein
MAPQRWWRTPGAGYAETVPAGGETALCGGPMLGAHSNGPRGCGGGRGQSFIRGGLHKNATAHSWHAHGTRERPWFLSRMRRDHYINLHG